MTVAELNLRTGDRIQEGNHFGTVLGQDYEACADYIYYRVQWDWDSGPTRYSDTQQVQWVALPRPVPTLASLKLKTGDVVQVTDCGNLYGLVHSTDSFVVDVLLWSKAIKSYELTQPASLLKKVLETPK